MRNLWNEIQNRGWTVLMALFILITIIGCQMKTESAHIYDVYTNGKIYSMDSEGGMYSTMVIKGDRILAVGTEEILDTLTGEHRSFDLGGQFVFPGWIEGHGHFISLGEVISGLDVAGAVSWDDVLEKTEEYGKEVESPGWIVGLGWHPNHWSEKFENSVEGYPTNKALSEMFPDQPVILWHSSMHALMANEYALELAEIDGETSDPEGGRIVRDRNGLATGILEETAMSFVTSAYNQWRDSRTAEEKWQETDRFLDSASHTCLSYGITTFVDAGLNLEELAQMKKYNEVGKSTVRLWGMLRGYEIWKDQVEEKVPFHSEDDRLMVKAVKAFADGALGANGAWMLEDYEDQPGWTGQNVTSTDELEKIGEKCLELGLQYCVHAIGDRANHEVLNIYERLFQNNNLDENDLRWRIEHAQILAPDDVERFRELGVIPSMQAIHCTSDSPMVIPKLGFERAKERGYVWQDLLRKGNIIANGTDTPVESVNPFENLYASVTRKRSVEGESFFPEQVMTREQAIRSLTIWNAYAIHLEDETGSLEPGKRADFMVVDTDLMECDEADILNASVIRTYVDGVLLYEK